MKINVDMHVHSNYSIDADNTIEEMCLSASQKGLKGICFTEHIDFNPNDYGYNYFKAEEFIEEIEKVKQRYNGQIRVFRGIEFSEPHLYRKEFEKYIDMDFDVILASIHWIEDKFVGQKEILDVYTYDKLFEKYYSMILETIHVGGFDVLAHLDFPKRYYGNRYNQKNIIEEILKQLIEKDIALEINTSTLRKGFNESMPSEKIIDKYLDIGGTKLTVGSDAHSCVEIASNFEQIEEFIKGKSNHVGFYEGREFFYSSFWNK